MTQLKAFKNIALLCLICLSINLFAQKKAIDKKNYSLLWEITGNGLSKPSYLFGTMHLRDKRVFEFTDSVLLKLEACDAFASEVRMDSAVYQSWELVMMGDTTNKLSRQLSKKGYERLLKALKSKGIDIDSMESKNTALVYNWLTDQEETLKGDNKDLLLDLYLTRLAYTQGKSIHGLERLEDYRDLNDSFFQQFEDSTFFQKDPNLMSILQHFTMMEQMIGIYQKGDIDKLSSIVKSEKTFNGSQYSREMLDNRNVHMLEKLENIMRQKSVFCAVGAAHLPDSMGMIALLRAKGYSIRKVTPQFTGLAEQFKPKKVDKDWYHLKDDFNHLELNFPEQPYLMNKLNANRRRLGVQYLYYDITTGALLMAESDFYPYSTLKNKSKDKILNDAFNDWVSDRNFKDLKKEKITIGENEGFKFTGRSSTKALVKGQFFVANGNIYKTFVFFDKHNEGDMERSDKFLKSLTINPLPLTNWQVFEEEKGAFSVKMPVKPDFQQVKSNIPDLTGEPLNYYANLFVSKEVDEGFAYMVRYSDMPSGRYVDNDSFYMAQLMEETVDRFRKMNATVEVDSLTRHYGCPEFNLKVPIDGINMLMRAILRGNRLYFLLGQPPLEKSKANSKKLDDWLNSFRFLPFKQPKLTKQVFPEMGISVGLPTSVEPYKYEETKSQYPSQSDKTIQITDNQIGAAYVITQTKYSKYYGVENVDSFWNKFTRNMMAGDGDILKVSVSDTLFKGIKAKLMTLDYLKSQNTYKSIVFEKEGYQYDFSLILPYELANDKFVNTYFESIDFIGNKEKQDIYTSKKPLILIDLASSIDTIQEEAKDALTQTEWTKEDLPLLTEAIQKKYADDEQRFNSTRLNLLNQITQFKDASTLAVLEKLFRSTEGDTLLRTEILCAFLDLDTLNSANRFFDMAKSIKQMDLEEFYCLRTFMTDSVARAKVYYDKMLSLSDKPFEKNMLVSTAATLADLDTLHLMREVFIRYTPQYLTAANALMNKNAEMLKNDTLGDDESDAYYLLSSYVRLFKNIPNTPEINQFLKKLSLTRQEDMLSEVVQAQAKIGQPVENSHWQRLSKNKLNWHYLLTGLKYDSSIAVVPPQYLNQKDIAEGIILSYMDEDYGEPKEFTLIDTQNYKGELLYIYKCLMDFGDEENNHFIAICSQPADKTKYTLEPTVQLMSEALKDVKNYKKIVEDLLKRN